MSEKDLALKAAVRRLFWRMGFSTRVDVPLRAYVSGPTAKSRYEEYTDLDVLGVTLGPDFRIQSIIADCKTSARRSTERMFWLSGVALFFKADNAYLVRSTEVTAAARQLASRLHISILTQDDLQALEQYHGAPAPAADSKLEFLFDPAAIARWHQTLRAAGPKLERLNEYRQSDYWVFDEYRNLQLLIGYLTEAASHLQPSDRVHLVLFLDCVWLYTLSLARAVQHVRRAHLADISTSLQEYMFGGRLGLMEKEAFVRMLREMTGREEASAGVLPPYYKQLLELVTRFARRPDAIATALRYCEWLEQAIAARAERSLSEIFGSNYDEIAAKLLADVCGFLVTAAQLPPEFRSRTRTLLTFAQPPDSTAAPATSAPHEERPAQQRLLE